MSKPAFSVIPVYSEIHNRKAMEQLMDRYLRPLEQHGGVRASAPPDPALPPVFLVLSGGSERQILQIFDNYRRQNSAAPLLLLAHPGNNSLPASLELLARVRQEGGRGRICYFTAPDATEPVEQLHRELTNYRVLRQLHSSRMALIGAPSDWLIASSQDTRTVEKRWGAELLHIPLQELEDLLHSVPTDRNDPLIAQLAGGAAEVIRLDRDDLSGAVHIYRQLRTLVDRHALDGLSLRCFDLVIKRKQTGCFALAQLNDEGIIAGCEGDLPAALGMLWGKLTTGTIPWMANPSRIDPAAEKLLLAHCTVPRSMSNGYRLMSHFESGEGVAIAGQPAHGPVTLFRLGGTSLEQLWCAEGELSATPSEPDLCRTQIEVTLTRGSVLELLERPLGNHTLVVPGHWRQLFSDWFAAYIAD